MTARLRTGILVPVTGVNPSRILQARHGSGHSQDSLARALETSSRNIARWEKGKHVPRAQHIAALAEATGKPIAFFFTEDGEADDEDESMASDLSAALGKIVRAEVKRVSAEGAKA